MEQPQQQPIASWSPDLDCWLESDDETQMGLFSVQPAVWSETWPTSGMTRDGSVYLLPAGAPRTSGSGSSSSPTSEASTPETSLLPTPRAGDGEKGGPNQRGSSGDLMLPSAVQQLLPTPEASDSSGGRQSAELGGTRPSGSKRAVTLATAVAHADDQMLPTPNAGLGEHRRDNGQPPERRREQGRQVSLADVACHLPTEDDERLLPTPRTGQNRNSRAAVTGANAERHGRTTAGSRSGLGLEQALEVARGETPHELLPTPTAQLASNQGGPSQHQRKTPPLDAVATLLPSPSAAVGEGGQTSRSGDRKDELLLGGVAKAYEDGGLVEGESLLPTPNGFHLENTETPEEWLVRRADVQERTDTRPDTRHGPALPVVALSVHDGHPLVQAGDGLPAGRARPDPWGPYAAGVHRWEAVTRPAPAPVEQGPKGGSRLAPTFVEWMMGLPAGHVTEVPGVTRNEQLKLLGNGVVEQQAEEALWWLLDQG